MSMDKLEDTDKLRRRFRVAGWVLSLVLAGLLLFRCVHSTVALFHWVERRIDRNSPLHMLGFLAVTLPFNLGLPIPVVHQAWSVAVGVFFGWKAFPLLFAMLAVGVPLPFLIGRRLARGDRVAVWIRRTAPGAMSYMTPLRRAVAARPVGVPAFRSSRALTTWPVRPRCRPHASGRHLRAHPCSRLGGERLGRFKRLGRGLGQPGWERARHGLSGSDGGRCRRLARGRQRISAGVSAEGGGP